MNNSTLPNEPRAAPNRSLRSPRSRACTDRAGGVRARPFSLIELIAVLIILGIMGAVAGLGLQYVVAGFVHARDVGGAAQDTQLAIARLMQEFTANCTVTSYGAATIHYTTQHDAASHTVAWSGSPGDPLLLDNDVLVENVADFAVTSDGTVLDVQLRLTATDAIEYRLQVYP